MDKRSGGSCSGSNLGSIMKKTFCMCSASPLMLIFVKHPSVSINADGKKIIDLKRVNYFLKILPRHLDQETYCPETNEKDQNL